MTEYILYRVESSETFLGEPTLRLVASGTAADVALALVVDRLEEDEAAEAAIDVSEIDAE